MKRKKLSRAEKKRLRAIREARYHRYLDAAGNTPRARYSPGLAAAVEWAREHVRPIDWEADWYERGMLPKSDPRSLLYSPNDD